MLYVACQGRMIVSGALPRRGRRTRGKRASQIKLLQGLPNVGPKRAVKLLDYFGTIEQIVTANEHELTRVEGIGAKTAQTIRWLVNEQKQIYTV